MSCRTTAFRRSTPIKKNSAIKFTVTSDTFESEPWAAETWIFPVMLVHRSSAHNQKGRVSAWWKQLKDVGKGAAHNRGLAHPGAVPPGIDSTKVSRGKLDPSGFGGTPSENSAFEFPRCPDLLLLPLFLGYCHESCFASMNRYCINER